MYHALVCLRRLTIHYPVRTCVKELKQSILSICQFVSPVKILNIDRVKRFLKLTVATPLHSPNPSTLLTCLQWRMWSGIVTLLPNATWVGRVSAVRLEGGEGRSVEGRRYCITSLESWLPSQLFSKATTQNWEWKLLPCYKRGRLQSKCVPRVLSEGACTPETLA